jgi:EpsD family peptidyl-prolyl cis-trans isomerase
VTKRKIPLIGFEMLIISRKNSIRQATALLFLLPAILVGCGEKTEDPAKPTQVVAKVNGAELSVHQLNFSLQGVQETSPEQMTRIRKAALDRIVEQEVIMQDAIDKKVDRDPVVRSQLDAARREILVRNHLQKLGSNVAVPPDDLIAKFYVENPALFRERQVYQFTEMVLPRVPANWAEFEKVIGPAKTMADVLEELRKKGVSLPVGQNIVRGAEDLPQDLLTKLTTIKDGEVVVYSRPPGIVIGQITARRTVPIDETRAKPAIVRHLSNKSQGEVVQSQVRKLMDSAKIAYVGEFSKDAKAAEPAAPKADDSGKGNAKDTGKDVLDKGLKTLK